MQTNKKFGFVLGVVAFIILLLVGDLDPTRPQVNTMAAIAVLVAILWITEALPLAATSLIPLIFFPITGILSTEEIASSYINTIIFLFLGGFLIAIAMEVWALHKRVALKIIKIFGGSPTSIILGFMASGAFLSMWISNTAKAAVRVFTSKRTGKITAPGVTWIGQEEDPAMAATSQAATQVRFGPQDRAQDTIILKHESEYFSRAIPIRAELEVSLDSYGKKARLSLMILICFGMPSSYTIGTPCLER